MQMSRPFSTTKQVSLSAISMLWAGDLRLSRFVVAIASIYWGVVMINGGDEVFQRPAYAYMEQLMDFLAWAAGFLVCGGVQMWRALRDVPVSTGPLSWIIGTVSCALWCYSTIAVFVSSVPPGPLNAGNCGIALLTCGILVRAVARHG